MSAFQRPDLVCLSHLRWGFVDQRPQHLMSRFGRRGRVFFCEEPTVGTDARPRLELSAPARGVLVVRPVLQAGLSQEAADELYGRLLLELLHAMEVGLHVAWYYTPLALRHTRGLAPAAVVYDCMDELTGFKGAAAELPAREAELLLLSDLVFTGGESLYEAKRRLHPDVHAFPSSVDVAHFAQAKALRGHPEPADQQRLPRPRIGFVGVIDERLDRELVEAVAIARPGWQLVLVGPVVKIDEASLPRRPNIHYLGAKSYDSLPAYLAGWDAAILPFALNEATRYISPTKTPEYLAAGCPVVSTPIRDVVRSYGDAGMVRIADTPERFVAEIEAALAHDRTNAWRARAVAAHLAGLSWDRTWSEMDGLLQEVLQAKAATSVSKRPRARRPRPAPPGELGR